MYCYWPPYYQDPNKTKLVVPPQTVTPPANYPITLEEAKVQVRVDYDVEDALILDKITAATDYVENEIGRKLITQTVKQTFPKFEQTMELWTSPVQSVSSVKYIDTDGVEQTLATDKYTVIGGDYITYIVPAYGEVWPSIRNVPNAVSITYVAGYGDYPRDVPRDIRQAILMLVGHWFENREAVIADNGMNVSEWPLAIQNILSRYKLRVL